MCTALTALLLVLMTAGCGGGGLGVDPKQMSVKQAPSGPAPTQCVDDNLDSGGHDTWHCGQRHGVVFVGDSIVGRMNLDEYFPGKGYVNAGWFGRRTDEMLAVFPQILDGTRVCHGYSEGPSDFPYTCVNIPPPAEVVIFLGWNNLLQSYSATQAAADIKQMAQMAEAAGAQVVLVTLYRWDSAHPVDWMAPWEPFNGCSIIYPWSDSLPALNAGIQQAGVDLHVKAIVDLYWLYESGCQQDYTIDGLHPSEGWPGYQQIADSMSQQI